VKLSISKPKLFRLEIVRFRSSF